MTANLVKKVLGGALASTLLFGNPERVYAPDLHKEMKEERTEYFDLRYDMEIERKNVLSQYSDKLGKESLDGWIKGKIDSLNPHELIDVNYVLATMKQESRFNPYAISPVGASGLMQIMPDTWNWIEGKNSFYEERFNQDKNLEVGIKTADRMAKSCERNHPNWEGLSKEEKIGLVAASYNGGNGHLISKNFDVTKTWDETQKYSAKVKEYYEEFEKISPLDFEEFKEKRLLENYEGNERFSENYSLD